MTNTFTYQYAMSGPQYTNPTVPQMFTNLPIGFKNQGPMAQYRIQDLSYQHIPTHLHPINSGRPKGHPTLRTKHVPPRCQPAHAHGLLHGCPGLPLHLICLDVVGPLALSACPSERRWPHPGHFPRTSKATDSQYTQPSTRMSGIFFFSPPPTLPGNCLLELQF